MAFSDMDGLFDQYPVSVLAAMQRAEVRRFVFSSSGCVYGEPDVSPIPETACGAVAPAPTVQRVMAVGRRQPGD